MKDIFDEGAINIPKSLPEIAGKKITLSYRPATAQDEAVINSYLPQPHPDGTPIQPSELPPSLPAYLINLKPELRIDGLVEATGSIISLGGTEVLEIAFYDPSTEISIIVNDSNAGSYNAIGLNVSKISKEQLAGLITKIEATKNKLEDSIYTELPKEDYIGDLLYAGAISYHGVLELSKFADSKYLGVNFATLPSENIFSYPLEVTSNWGIPMSVSHRGVSMDADRLLSIVKAHDGDRETARKFMVTSGLQSSALENSIPERIFSTDVSTVDGISAVKALKIASDFGIPVHSIYQNNMDALLPDLIIDENLKEELRMAVLSGNIVTVSKSNISYNGWIGCGYIITNPATGAGAYMISNSLSGSYALLGSYFTAITDIISKGYVKKSMKPSTTLSVFSTLGKILTVIGYAVTVTNIVSNPKLNELQKVLEIITWLMALCLMIKAGILIGGYFTFLPAMLLAIVAYIVITVATLSIIDAIEAKNGNGTLIITV